MDVIYHLANHLDRAVENLYSAARVLLVAAIVNRERISFEDIVEYCCRDESLTLTFSLGKGQAIVRAVPGSLSRQRIPLTINTSRMPPLKPFVQHGVININDNTIEVKREKLQEVVASTTLSRKIIALLQALSVNKYMTLKPAGSFSRYMRHLKYALILRSLFSGKVELFAGEKELSEILKTLRGKYVDLRFVLKRLFVKRPVVLVGKAPDLYRQRKPRGVVLQEKPLTLSHRSKACHCQAQNSIVVGVCSPLSTYRVPLLLRETDFKGKIVADMGCGYGSKGAFAIAKGALNVVFIDLHKPYLKRRKSALRAERVMADIRFLPLRSKSIDITLLWNVLQFVRDKNLVLNEVRRVTQDSVLMSVYSAKYAVWNYDYHAFVEDCNKLGRIMRVMRLGNSQFCAKVVVC